MISFRRCRSGIHGNVSPSGFRKVNQRTRCSKIDGQHPPGGACSISPSRPLAWSYQFSTHAGIFFLWKKGSSVVIASGSGTATGFNFCWQWVNSTVSVDPCSWRIRPARKIVGKSPIQNLQRGSQYWVSPDQYGAPARQNQSTRQEEGAATMRGRARTQQHDGWGKRKSEVRYPARIDLRPCTQKRNHHQQE